MESVQEEFKSFRKVTMIEAPNDQFMYIYIKQSDIDRASSTNPIKKTVQKHQ